jgi:Holliday junction resolvasome RuvABC endonuclease subunit
MDGKSPVVDNVFVGLDLSLTGTGFCVKRGSKLEMRTIKTNPRTAVNDLARLEYIRDTILDLIPKSVSLICVEDYFVPYNPKQIGAAIDLIGLGMVVRVALYRLGLPFFVINNNQLKKYVTGKGSGQKSLILMAAYKRWGVEAKDDNQADSAVLSYIAEGLQAKMDGHDVSSLPSYQVEVLKKVMDDQSRYNLGTEA